MMTQEVQGEGLSNENEILNESEEEEEYTEFNLTRLRVYMSA